MKCECPECEGRGTIPCPECDGNGETNGNIETIELLRGMHNYDELKALKRDAARVRKQTEQLKQLNPTRAESYEAQMNATLETINRLAEKAAKK